MEPASFYPLRSRLNNETITLMAGDIFRFKVEVYYDLINSDSISSRHLLHRCPHVFIRCHKFFQEGREFLRTLLSSIQFYVPSPDDIIERVMSTIGERFLPADDDAYPSEYTRREFPFALNIVLDRVYNLDDLQAASVEESLQSFRMIPSSNEAIETSLKTSTVTTRSESPCPICLEHLEINDECCTLPCNHVFHSQCIVTWLKTSNMCALCRYALPTV